MEHQLRRPSSVGTAPVHLDLSGTERASPVDEGRPGTLLGPEGTARYGRLLHDGPGRSDEPPALLDGELVGAGAHDSGIVRCLRTAQWTRASLKYVFVVKFLRAQGGCLGTRSRRRTW